MSRKVEYILFGLVLCFSEKVAAIQLRHELHYRDKTRKHKPYPRNLRMNM